MNRYIPILVAAIAGVPVGLGIGAVACSSNPPPVTEADLRKAAHVAEVLEPCAKQLALEAASADAGHE